MSSRKSSSEIFEFLADSTQFKKWNARESDIDWFAHIRKCIPVAINEGLTEKQRRYFLMYYVDNLSLRQIAELEGVDHSTVSREVKSAKKRLKNMLRFSAPWLLNAPITTKNRRDKKG